MTREEALAKLPHLLDAMKKCVDNLVGRPIGRVTFALGMIPHQDIIGQHMRDYGKELRGRLDRGEFKEEDPYTQAMSDGFYKEMVHKCMPNQASA